mmetsp:Transcript_14993/g.35735  ORF Transcript_14993/g.35735 Transcript_14993/m.35735 type:complete len:94 (-) Transcript_14993:1468-1749(-)
MNITDGTQSLCASNGQNMKWWVDMCRMLLWRSWRHEIYGSLTLILSDMHMIIGHALLQTNRRKPGIHRHALYRDWLDDMSNSQLTQSQVCRPR